MGRKQEDVGTANSCKDLSGGFVGKHPDVAGHIEDSCNDDGGGGHDDDESWQCCQSKNLSRISD